MLAHLLFPVLSSIILSLLLSALASFFTGKISRWLTALILTLISVFYIVECIVRRTYQTYMTVSSMLAGGGNVLGEFRSDLIVAVVNSFYVMILFLLPVILYLIFGKRILPDKKPGLTYRMGLLLASVIIGLGTAFYEGSVSSVSDLFREQYEYDTASQTFGLLTGTLLDFAYGSLPGSKTVSFVDATEGVDGENTEMGQSAENTGAGEEEKEADAAPANQPDGDNDPEGMEAENTESESTEAESTVAESTEPEEIDYGCNVLNIDFDALIASETNSNIIALHEYVSGLEPTSKNQYTGLFEGKNLILITAEAFSAQVISEELTPTLYRLANQGIKFTDFYQPAWGGSTSTGEYSVLLGLVPTDGVSSMYETIGKNVYYTMGNMLGQQGYSTLAFHNGTYTVYRRNETHTNLGYDDFLTFGSGLLDIQQWSNYDVDTISAILEHCVDDQPFSWYWMTYSGHGAYKAGDSRTTRNIERVREVLGDTYQDTTLYYFCYQMELEAALTTLVETLEEKGIAQDTVIVLCTDHYPYGLAKSTSYGNSEN
ncbi:MAG: sulfatase-like hydrolase/transferase, partial [Lachnospiraceae bacterium]|nr:sulfatase-like hydrolase/transferase [Lachnospiraceae bacterium]